MPKKISFWFLTACISSNITHSPIEYIRFFPSEEETGIDPGWINNGGIFIANNKERLDEYQRLGTIGKEI